MQPHKGGLLVWPLPNSLSIIDLANPMLMLMLSRIKWPESCNEILTNAQLWVKIPKECVLACFQGVKLPFGYIEIIARSAHVLPMPDLKIQV